MMTPNRRSIFGQSSPENCSDHFGIWSYSIGFRSTRKPTRWSGPTVLTLTQLLFMTGLCMHRLSGSLRGVGNQFRHEPVLGQEPSSNPLQPTAEAGGYEASALLLTTMNRCVGS